MISQTILPHHMCFCRSDHIHPVAQTSLATAVETDRIMGTDCGFHFYSPCLSSECYISLV